MILRSFNINNISKGFSLIELLVVVGILGVLAAVGIVSYIGYVGGTQRTVAQSNLHAIAMVQEDFRAGNPNNVYYTGGANTGVSPCLTAVANCAPALANHETINDCIFGGREQLEESSPDFLFCIATGLGSDGGFLISAERPDGSDFMDLNANNEKTGPGW